MTPRPEPATRLQRVGEHAKALVALCGAIALLASAVGAAAAHYAGPSTQTELHTAIARGDALISRRVDAHTAQLARIDSELATMRREQQLTAYLQCVFARRIDPTLTPPECSPVITAWRAR